MSLKCGLDSGTLVLQKLYRTPYPTVGWGIPQFRETFPLQGILHPPQWKCKATSDLANGTIPEYPTPFFIESGAPVVLNRLTFFSQCKVPKICPFARLRVALHFFHTHTTATTTDRLDSTRSAGALCCSICSLPSAAARYRRFVRRRFEPIHHLLSLLPMESNCQLLVVLCV